MGFSNSDSIAISTLLYIQYYTIIYILLYYYFTAKAFIYIFTVKMKDTKRKISTIGFSRTELDIYFNHLMISQGIKRRGKKQFSSFC